MGSFVDGFLQARKDSLIQFKVLFFKNLRMLYRNWKITMLVIVPPIVAVAILFMMQFIPTDLHNSHPDAIDLVAISSCQGRTDGDKNCYPMVYTFDGGLQGLADQFMLTLAGQNGLNITSDLNEYGSIVRFADYPTMKAWLVTEDNFNHTYGAVYFMSQTNSSQNYEMRVYHNSTCQNLLFPCPTERFRLDFTLVRAFLGTFLVDVPEFYYNYSSYPILSPSNESVRDFGTLFYYFASSFFFVVLVAEVVSEKELKLRIGMQMMGLRHDVYWLSWFVHSQILLITSVLLLICTGLAFQIPYFLYTNFFVNFLVFWLFGLCMNNLSFLLAAMLPSTRLAIYVSLGLSMVGLLLVTLFSGQLGSIFFPYAASTSSIPIQIFSIILHCFPMYNFTIQLFDINSLSYESDGVRGPGYGFEDLFYYRTLDTGTNPPTYFSMLWNVGIFVVLGVLTWYFDRVMPGNSGKSEPIWFPLSLYYWGILKPKASRNTHMMDFERDEDEVGVEVDSDVRDEYARVMDPANEDPVKIYGVRKIYRKYPLISSKKDMKACKNFSVSIPQGSLLALLGHNGAGKSTTFNILTGLFPPTEGDGEICGRGVVSEMGNIRRIIGVCPQHDILWDNLTAREHLELFADMKDFFPWPWQRSKRREQLDHYMEAVKLTAVQNQLVGTYSGGMKRRLSVAIALIGNPQGVFLDEPTTGMDPLSRRHVWNLIQAEKKSRVIVLTTHLMEEADILGDRIAVMSHGLIRAIGTSIHLKNKYGNGYRINVVAYPDQVEACKQIIQNRLPEATLHSEMNQYLTFGLKSEGTDRALVDFFRSIEVKDAELSAVIESASVSGPTLEDVFLSITANFH